MTTANLSTENILVTGKTSVLGDGDTGMSGYLYKKTRDDRWQKRWFETNGVYLTYYKSRKMEKLLAALSLPQVGEIKIVTSQEDPDGQTGLFTIELNTRIYTLRAKSDEEAYQWVNTLNKLRRDGLKIPSSRTDSTGQSSGRINSFDVSSTFTSRENSQQSQQPATDWIKTGKSLCSCCC